MVAPRSRSENDFVHRLIMAGGSERRGHWIACDDIKNEGQWFCDGHTYRRWKRGKPSDPLSDCAKIDGTGKWADRPCRELFPALCRRGTVDAVVGFQLQSWRLLVSCLMGHVMHQFPANSINACAVECSHEPGCLSFNILHQGKEKICQLNEVRRFDVNQKEFISVTNPFCIYGEE